MTLPASALPPAVALLFACTRQPWGATDATTVRTFGECGDIDWAYIAATALAHGIAPLLWTNLQQSGLAPRVLPPAIAHQLQQATYQNIAVKAGVMVKLAEVCAFCQARAIDVMAIKGMALDLLVYAQPWYTVHDVDLILRPVAPLDPAVSGEVERFFWPLPGFEYEFDTHHDVTMNGVLAVDFTPIWASARQLEVRGQPLWVMDPVHLVLTAAINSARKRFFHLKQLLAIASLLAHYPTLDGAHLAAHANAYGCAALVYAALRVTATTVGCTLPTGFVAAMAVHPLRVQLIDRLVSRVIARIYGPPRPTWQLYQRAVDPSLLLPYACYSPAQLLHKACYLWRTRRRPRG